MTMPELGSAGGVLLVDDDQGLLRAYARLLGARGWKVKPIADASEALAEMKTTTFDVIVSDVDMPGMNGLDFLRNVRAQDLDVPVVLVSGHATLDVALRAMEFGAFRFLLKPLEATQLDEILHRAAKLHELARLKREAFAGSGNEAMLGDRAALEARFASALAGMWPAFQPIIGWKERRVFGYEALLRSSEPALPHPGAVLDAAERLGRLHDVGRAMRALVAAASSKAPAEVAFFVNLHAVDLADEDLYRADSAFAAIAPRVVLEITERASLDGITDVPGRVAKLRAMGFRIAVDDLGAGYAGLTAFTQLEPHVAKLDMSLVRGIDTNVRAKSVVRSMVRLCAELDIQVVAEGVETPAERDALCELACPLLQGYYFGRPDRAFASPKFDDLLPR